MKRILSLLIFTMFTALFSSCAAPEEKATAATASATTTPSPTENVEQTLANLEREWAEASVKADVAALDRIVADDFSYTNWDGTITTKAPYLEDMKAKAYKIESMIPENIKVRQFGDVAVVTLGQLEKSQYKGKDTSGYYLYTDTCVKRNGRWQIVAGHGCKIAAPKPKP